MDISIKCGGGCKRLLPVKFKFVSWKKRHFRGCDLTKTKIIIIFSPTHNTKTPEPRNTSTRVLCKRNQHHTVMLMSICILLYEHLYDEKLEENNFLSTNHRTNRYTQ